MTLGLEPFVDALPVPPVWSSDELALRGLEMAESTHRFHRDLGPVPTWVLHGPDMADDAEAPRGRRGRPSER